MIKDFLIFIRDIALFLIAWGLFLPLSIVNFVVVACRGGAKGYFFSSALALDKYANRELRTLWNVTLRTSKGYPFGNVEETISSALGKNERDGTLTWVGKVLVWLLDKLDKGHARKSINDEVVIT